MYGEFSGEDIWKIMEIFFSMKTFESHWDQSPRNKNINSVAISGIYCEMGFMGISAKLYSFPNYLYTWCLMWKKLFAIKINKHCSSINYK